MHVFSTSNSSHVFFFSARKKLILSSQTGFKPSTGRWLGGRLHWVTEGGLNRVRGEATPEEGGRSMFKFTATVEKQAERAAVHPPDVHSLALIRSWLTVKWTEQGPPWGGLQQHSTCPILGGISVMCRFLAPPSLSPDIKSIAIWFCEIHWTQKQKKKTRRISILAPLGNLFVLWCNLVSDICCKCKTEKEGEWKKV